MGRPIGSMNRQKPFTDMLRVALLSGGGRRLRVIAEKLAEKAEQGDLQAIREIADRLDGKPQQAIERGDAPLEALSDRELFAIIRDKSGVRWTSQATREFAVQFRQSKSGQRAAFGDWFGGHCRYRFEYFI